EVADALLPGAVVVGVFRDAEADGAGDERLADRVVPADVADHQRAVAAAVGIVAVADSLLGPAEVGQHLGEAPAAVAALRPAVEVGGLAAVVDVAVDRARAAQRLALGAEQLAAGRPLVALDHQAPGDARAHQRFHEAGRDVDVGIPVAAPGLQQADGR